MPKIIPPIVKFIAILLVICPKRLDSAPKFVQLSRFSIAKLTIESFGGKVVFWISIWQMLRVLLKTAKPESKPEP